MRKYISVDKGAIQRNKDNNTYEPVLLVEWDDDKGKPLRGYQVIIQGASRLVYDPNSVRIAKAWLETDRPLLVEVIGHTQVPID